MPHSPWAKADLHVHTNHSDGADSVHDVLAFAASETDVRVLAITDHDRISGALEAQRLAPEYGLRVIVGQEVTTQRGHLLALFIRELVPAGLSIPETSALIHRQGGLAVLAHPCDPLTNCPLRHWPRPRPHEWAAFDVDALEALNGCQIAPRASSRAAELGRRLGRPLTGGSDAHCAQAVGTAYTLFLGTGADDLRRALVTGTCRPGGHGWAPREYAGWFTQSWWPRAYRQMRRTALALAALHAG